MLKESVARMVVLAVVPISIGFAPSALAQGWPDRSPGARPDKRDFAPRPPRKTSYRPGAESPEPMQVAGGKLYIVTGQTVRKLDAKTLEQEGEAQIPVPTQTEQQTKAKERFMERFDKNGDGFVREDEVRNSAIIRRFDKDGDGAISISEVPSPGATVRPPTGPVTLLVEGADLYVYRGGWLYRFDTEDLVLQAQREVAPRPAPGPRSPRGDWREKWGKRDRKKRRENKYRTPEGTPTPPPEPPDDPVRF